MGLQHVRLISLVTLVLLFTVQLSTGSRILFLFAGGNLSHKTSIWPFVHALAERGHDVTFISSHRKTPVPHPNITDVAADALVEATANAYNVNRFESRQAGKEVELWDTYDEISLQVCDRLLKAGQTEPNFRAILNPSTKYDVIIINAVYGECGFILARHLQAKYIVYGTSLVVPWWHGSYGIPWQSSWIPEMTVNLGSKGQLSFLDRLRNFWAYIKMASRSSAIEAGIQTLHQRYLPESAGPSLVEMERNASLVFVSTHPAIDFARPLPPLFVQVGGMQCLAPVGALPPNFQKFMDEAEGGVILIAFGSTIDFNKLTTEHLHMFYRMMRKFSTVRFIWRWTGESPKEAPSNLLGAEWLPQKEILSHPNLRAFMTHCGMGSVSEAACYGAPLIAVPLFADQDLSAHRIQAQQLGVYLEVRDLSQATLDHAVNEVLTRPEFKINMAARAGIMKDRPMNAVDTAAYWTEYVIRHDDMSAFKPMELAEQSVFVRQMFDVFLVLALTAVAIPGLVMLVVLRWLRKFM